MSAIDYEYNAGTGFSRVHRYSLSYAAPHGERAGRAAGLRSITQCGPRDCLPATTFDWDERVDDRATEILHTIPVDKTVFGDYNGDGATDVFGGYPGRWAVWQANPQTGGFLAPISLGNATFSDTSVGVPLDYNGDGLTDLMIGSSQIGELVGTGRSRTGRHGYHKDYRDCLVRRGAEVKPMDIDGDGFDDLVYLRDGMAYIRRNTGGGPRGRTGERHRAR